VDPFVALSGTHWRLDENLTIDDCNVDPLSSWTLTRLSASTGQADPFGGTAAVEYTDTVDGSSVAHQLVGVVNNGVASGLVTADFYLKFSAGLTHATVQVSATQYVFVDVQNGTLGSPAGGAVVSISDAGNGWRKVSMRGALGTNIVINPCKSGGTSAYQGDGTGKMLVYVPTITQKGVSQIGARVGSYGAFVQATRLRQPLPWTGTAWSAAPANGLEFQGTHYTIAGSGTAAQPDTVVLVWQVAAVATSYGVYSGGTSTAGNLTTSASTIKISSGAQKDTSQAPTTSPMISVTRYNGATSWHRKNGTQTADLSIGTSSRTGGLMIGQINGGTPTLTGRILDVAYFAGGLDATGAARIEKALAQLRGITLA
jgi:hypothetical protein